MRVHEIASELKLDNKEVIEFLRTKNVDVKSHMSTLGADEIAMVKANFAGKSADAPAEAPKKKNIVQVFRPQNSQNNRGGNKPYQKRDGQTQGQRPNGPRPERSERPAGPRGERPTGQRAERPAVPQGQQIRTERPAAGAAPARIE